jgi:hypothetical protein
MTSIAADIASKIRAGKIDPTNAIAIVKHVADVAHGDREAAIDMLTVIANGADGISGTADDVFPPQTLAQLRTLLESQLVGQLTTALASKKILCC